MLGGMLPARNKVLAAALLLPVVLVSVLSTSFALWRCRSDGLARASCCCPSKVVAAQTGDTGERNLTISRARCCDLERHQLERAPAELGRGRTIEVTDLIAATVAAVPVALLPIIDSPPAPVPTALALDRLAAGRSLIVQKQTFLI